MFWNKDAAMQELEEKVAHLEGELEVRVLSEMDSIRELKDANFKLENSITELKGTKNSLEQDIKNLASEKEREEINIKHATKILEEKNEIEFEKKVAAVEREKDVEIGKIKDEYRDKIEKQLDTRGTEMKEMYINVLDKLTSVTGTLNVPAKVVATKEK